MIGAVVISLLGAAVPTVVYVSIAWWLDRYEKEPWWLLAMTFAWGALPAVILAVILEIAFSISIAEFHTADDSQILTVTVAAPITEELFKAVPLLAIFLLYRREFDGLMDGLLYGSLVGFGFAMTENIMYFLSEWANGGIHAVFASIFLRALVFGMMHALWSSMFGIGLGIARYARSRFVAFFAPVFGLAAAMLLHGIHNYFAVQGGFFIAISFVSYALGCLLWQVMVYVAIRQEGVWIAEELGDEVGAGVISTDQALACGRYSSRLAARWAILREHGFGHAHRLGRLYAMAAELALKKRQLKLNHREQENVAEIARLRSELWKVRESLQ